jgi:metal-responsive CopG/Arc/MetJ family transcriptional regulator
MAKQTISVRLDDEALQLLDARCEREGLSRQALLDFAIEPLLRDGEVRVLNLPAATIEMLDRIASGQKINRVDVCRRALIDYAARAAERWQINAPQADVAKLKLLTEQMGVPEIL